MMQMESRPRVVVTGLGAVTPLGNTVPEFWGSLIDGASGIAPITRFDATPFQTRIAGEVKGFEPERFLDRRTVRRSDRYTHYAVAATSEAVADAALDLERESRDRIGVVIGSAVGGVETLLEQYDQLQERGPQRLSPFLWTSVIPDAAGAQIAIEYHLEGPSYALASACATGTDAIGQGAELIRRGAVDVVIAGGSEAPIFPLAIGGFNAMKVMSTRNEEPSSACRPFDATRDGFVMGEGCGIVILESEAHARSRGAHIYAEVAGYGSHVDGVHLASPAEEGMGIQRAMKTALTDAKVRTEDVNYINAHGTGTRVNDLNETAAIKAVFGEAAYDLAVSSTKGATGHMMGAAGAVEAIVCIKSIQTGVVPPTLNLNVPDPACDLDYVPHQARALSVDVAISNSIGLGGHNAAIVVRRYEEQVKDD